MARITAAEARREHRETRFTAAIAGAATGQEKARIAWDWVRAEMSALAKRDQAKASTAWHHLAADLEAIALDAAKEAANATCVVTIR